MDIEQIKALQESLKTVCLQAIDKTSENAFLKRVLRQACLTNGGSITVDVSLAEAAKDETLELFFGNGKVEVFSK